MNDANDTAARNRKTLTVVLLVVACMIGMSFAAVPLYRLFCQMTGYNGTTQVATSAPDRILDRTVTVRFNTDVSPGIPWRFKPEKAQVKTRIGAQNLISYEAANESGATLMGTALYNVTPPKAGKYFEKIQCFCFQEQVLKPGEQVRMPVLFFISPAFADDPNMNDVDTITLSYTFFKADTAELDKALDDFYNASEQTP